jgi:methionyl-tRNA formyltransferase
MGTPQFAVPSLEALIRTQNVVAVITQPDAPAGRGKALTPSAVKLAALGHGLPVLQPESLKPPEVVEQLRAFQPDAIVVAAFGQILRKAVLEMPRHGCINVHGSLLPRWRGASPVSAAIAAGDANTGVTIMAMEAGLDTGPMFSKVETPIRADDTTGTLLERLSFLGADLLAETLPRIFSGELRAQPQSEAEVTGCGQLKKEDGRIDWARPAAEIERHVRAMQPWPSAWTTLHGKTLKVIRASLAPRGGGQPGTVGYSKEGGLTVICGDAALVLHEVQLEGKKAMAAGEFARGQQALNGAVLA